MELADIDGDGLLDIVSGKRFWAHGPSGDAEPNAPPALVVFRLTRNGSAAKYEPQLVSDIGGVGTQVTIGDLNQDQWPDIVVGNKLGTFVYLQKKHGSE